MDYGWFGNKFAFLVKPLLKVLQYFYNMFNNYGWALLSKHNVIATETNRILQRSNLVDKNSININVVDNVMQVTSKIEESQLYYFEGKNKLKVVFCIGENKTDKKKNRTFKVLKKQIENVLEKKFNYKDIIVAYEPIWSIGTGKIPEANDLLKTTLFIKKVLKIIFKKPSSPAVLYGGSVDVNNIAQFRNLNEIDGFLIGGASKSDKKFIDIIKNYYR
jgi:predicted MPP superfamily phosphohydrolase